MMRLRYALVSLPAALILGLALLLSSFTSGSPANIEPQRETTGVNSPASSLILRVPYVSQGASSWCFESSLDMVLQYWGKKVSLQDVTLASGHSANTSNNVLDVFLGWVHPYISQWPDLAYSHDIRAWDFERYKAEIDRNRPVIASNFGLPGHTLVVVGYSLENGQRYIYLHDPSGYLTRLTWGSGNTYARIKWEVFQSLPWTELTIRRAD